MEFFNWYIIWLMILFSLSLPSPSFMQASNGYDPLSLTNFLHDYANASLRNLHTGTLYNISLPANFSGMEASFVRILSAKFWSRGANFSSFYIPPKVTPIPSSRRLAIVFENLGNWSSLYYKISNYTLVAPVVGFMAYDSPNGTVIGNQKLTFTADGDPITIRFPHIDAAQGENMTRKCVQFGDWGTFEITNMTSENECITRGIGHFSIVVASPPAPTPAPAPVKKKRNRKWFVVGIVFGLAFLGLVMIVTFKLLTRRKLKSMEKQSEKDVAFDTFWVGRSKMPSASMTRTQPYLEHEYVP